MSRAPGEFLCQFLEIARGFKKLDLQKKIFILCLELKIAKMSPGKTGSHYIRFSTLL